MSCTGLTILSTAAEPDRDKGVEHDKKFHTRLLVVTEEDIFVVEGFAKCPLPAVQDLCQFLMQVILPLECHPGD